MESVKSNKLEIFKKVSYVIAGIPYVLFIISTLLKQFYTNSIAPDYIYTLEAINYTLLTVNLYLAIANVFILKKVKLFILQILPVLIFSFLGTVLSPEQNIFFISFFKEILKFFIPFPFWNYVFNLFN